MQQLGEFLTDVERRAYRIAVDALRDRDDALDVVQRAMLRLVRSYRKRPSDEWGPLFYRILYNGIRDWRRRQAVRSRIFARRADEGPRRPRKGLARGEWDQLPPQRQATLSRGARRRETMTPDQRAGARQRFERWQSMPPEQRQRMRQRWQEDTLQHGEQLRKNRDWSGR